MLTYEQARRTVIEQAEKAKGPRATATLSVWDALGFVLAEGIKTDRDYPPFHRSTRDGYAVRAAEVTSGAILRCVAETKAGDTVAQPLAPGTCVQIMTGAAVPAANLFCAATPPIASRICATKSSAVCAKTSWSFPAAAPWASTTSWKPC